MKGFAAGMMNSEPCEISQGTKSHKLQKFAAGNF